MEGSFIFLNTENVKSTKHTYCTTSLHMLLWSWSLWLTLHFHLSSGHTSVNIDIWDFDVPANLHSSSHPPPLPFSLSPLSLSLSWLLIRGKYMLAFLQSSVQQYSNSPLSLYLTDNTTCAWLIQLQAHVSETITTAQMFHRPFVLAQHTH